MHSREGRKTHKSVCVCVCVCVGGGGGCGGGVGGGVGGGGGGGGDKSPYFYDIVFYYAIRPSIAYMAVQQTSIIVDVVVGYMIGFQ